MSCLFGFILKTCVLTQPTVELALDSGKTRILRQGDVFIQRGTLHGWKNHSTTQTARMVCFILPATPLDFTPMN